MMCGKHIWMSPQNSNTLWLRIKPPWTYGLTIPVHYFLNQLKFRSFVTDRQRVQSPSVIFRWMGISVLRGNVVFPSSRPYILPQILLNYYAISYMVFVGPVYIHSAQLIALATSIIISCWIITHWTYRPSKAGPKTCLLSASGSFFVCFFKICIK
jgi:hypothetical protein